MTGRPLVLFHPGDMFTLNTKLPLFVVSCVFGLLLADQPCAAQAVEPAPVAHDLAGDDLPARGALRFGTTRFRILAAGADVLFAGPSTLVTFCPDRYFSVGEWPGGKRRFMMKGADDPIRALGSLAGTGKLVVSLATGALSIIDVANGKREAHLDPAPYVTTGLAVSVDGKEVVCGSEDGRLHVRTLPDGKEVRVLGNGPLPIVGVAYASPSRIVSLNRGGRIQVWDGEAGKPAADFDAGAGSTRFLVSPDGAKAWVAGGAGSVSCWRLSDGTRLLSVAADAEEARCVALSPDGSQVLTGGRDGRVRAWNADIGKEVWSTQVMAGWVSGVAVSPDGKAVVSVGEDRAAHVLDAANGADLVSAAGHTSDVLCVAVSPDGRTLATGGWDRSVRLWNAETSRQIACFSDLNGPVYSLSWDPSGASVAVVAGREVVVLEAKGESKRRLLGSGASMFRSVAWCGATSVVTGGTDTMLRVWSTKDGTPPRELEGHATMVAALAASPDGQLFISAGTDGKAAIWNLAAGKPTWLDVHPQPVTAVAFSADGLLAATGCQDACIRLWDAKTGKFSGIIRGFDGMVTGVAFSPDGKLIAGCAAGNSVRICESPSGREVVLLHGLGGSMNGVCWTPDGKRVITAMHDTTAIAWQVRK